jgi:hypothetical protein
MQLPREFHGVACGIFAAALLVAAAPVAAQEAAPGGQLTLSIPDASLQELTITLRLDNQGFHRSNVPRFRVELRNAGQHGLLLNLGTMTSDGARQYPSAISLVLVGPEGRPQRLELKTFQPTTGPGYKPLALPLPAGGTFSFPVDLDNYWVLGSNGFNSKLGPGKYSLIAQFGGLSGLMNVRLFPEQVPRELPVSEAPFDHVYSQASGIPTSNRMQFEITR